MGAIKKFLVSKIDKIILIFDKYFRKLRQYAPKSSENYEQKLSQNESGEIRYLKALEVAIINNSRKKLRIV